jgi:hypothetical protein
LLTQTFETQIGHPMGQTFQLGIVIRILQMMDHLLLLGLLLLLLLLLGLLLVLLALWCHGCTLLQLLRRVLLLLLLLVVKQLLLATHLLGLISLLLLLLLRVALANRTVQSLRRRGVNERVVAIVQHFGRRRRSGRRRREERISVTRVTQTSDNGRRAGHGAQTAASPRLLERLLVLLLLLRATSRCRRLLRLPQIADDGSRAARRYSRTCGVGRIGAISQAAQHFGRGSNNRRRGGARKSRVVTLLGRGRRTVVVPCVTGVTGHQVPTTATRIVVVVAVAVVGRGQADDLALDESFTRHGTDGRRRAHDGWNSSCAHHTATADAADVVVAGRARTAVESAGIIPESLCA